jgi:hypothetical protein
MKTLKHYLKIATKDVKNINNGGCGFFAKHFGEKLSLLGYKVKYIMLTHNKECVDDIKKSIVKRDTLGVLNSSWTHILLLVDNKFYVDSKGIYDTLEDINDRDCSERYEIEINLFILDNMLKPKYILRWNPVFDRVNDLKKLIKNINSIN